MSDSVLAPPNSKVPQSVWKKTLEFLDQCQPFEIKNGAKLCLYVDEKSAAFYVTCHLDGRTLVQYCYTDASINGDEDDEIYKLNREITEDQAAYIAMERDALSGRSFEDIVLEFDTTYRSKKPLKVYGGPTSLNGNSEGRINQSGGTTRRQGVLRSVPRAKG